MPAGRLSTAARQAAIQERYGRIAETADQAGCGGGGADADVLSAQLGYTPDELASVPSGGNLGLGCGTPLAMASLKPGETVLDLGSGAGLDCFLAARRVGDHERVIGMDMTPAMIARSRHNAQSQGNRYANVEFRLGEIEHLPVADASVDVILSNCVINLASNKRQVFQEAYRVLKSGGRLAISDIVASREIPPEWREDVALWTGCMAGAAPIDEIETLLTNIGFAAVRIVPQSGSHEFIREWGPNTPLTAYVVSAAIEALKP
ncbi:MAG: arsenite methyltransferase [Firmicutes bacterium]|nr:arsenite methyltransferase [Bacillota bacterium]